MTTSLLRLPVVLCLLMALPGVASAAIRGYVERPWTPTTCLQGSHFLTDPCTGNISLADDTQALDLDPYLCKYVVVNGPDIGVECTVIAPSSIVESQAPCPITFGDLWLTGADPPTVNWDRVICAPGYDVVRGDVASVVVETSRINLGPVLCAADNWRQENWWFVTGPADGESPPLGQAFFYLVRAPRLPFGDSAYGYSSDGREEVPGSGDCSS